MKFRTTLTAALLAFAAVGAQADTTTTALDLSSGNTTFGRNSAVGSFIDTYTFTLMSVASFTGTATTSASGTQDLNFSSLVIQNSANAVVATFAGNLGTSINEFYALAPVSLGAGTYSLIVTGTNSATQASYAGTLAVTPVPEPSALAMMLAGIGAMGFVTLRRRQT